MSCVPLPRTRVVDGGVGAGCQAEDLRVIAITQREPGNFGGSSDSPQSGTLRLQIFRGRLNGDLLGLLADLKRTIQLWRLGDIQRDCANLGCLKTGGGEADVIGAGRQQIELVRSIRTSDRGTRLAGIVVDDSNGDVGNCRAGLIGDVTS